MILAKRLLNLHTYNMPDLTENTENKKFKFVPTKAAILLPRRMNAGTADKPVWVGVGGDITIAANPPKRKAVTIKEATQAQYKKLVNRCGSISHLVQKKVD